MNYEIEVLVSGRKVDTYNLKTETYIEGRQGTPYKLNLKNNSGIDAEFVVSIDGLSINNGKPASKNSPGYIVKAYSSCIIDGWLVDSETAAKFVFGSKKSSYVATSGQDIDNAGVIGLQVFPKKYVPIEPQVINHYWHDWFKHPSYPAPYKQYYNQYDKYWLNPDVTYTVNNTSIGSCSISKGLESMVSNMAKSPIQASSQQLASSETLSLGTEFGDAVDFNTTQVAFERASGTASFTTSIYYGDKNDLNKLGIILNWQKEKTPAKKPNAFPGDYCQPPTDWKK